MLYSAIRGHGILVLLAAGVVGFVDARRQYSGRPALAEYPLFVLMGHPAEQTCS